MSDFWNFIDKILLNILSWYIIYTFILMKQKITMHNTNIIFDKTSDIDSLYQERLFLEQKYRKDVLSKKNIETLEDIDIKNVLFEKLEEQTRWKNIENPSITIFDLFAYLWYDEKKFIRVMRDTYIASNDIISDDTHSYIAGKDAIIETDDRVKRIPIVLNQITRPQALLLASEFNLYIDLILHDIRRYWKVRSLLQEKKKELIQINGTNISIGTVSDLYSHEILSTLRKNILHQQNKGSSGYNKQLSSHDIDIWGISPEDITHAPKDIQDMVWKYDFFKKIQKSINDGYILTYKEIEFIQDVVKDLQNNKVVLFTGDTGSGKTELARFICTEYVGSGEYVFISGSKDLVSNDFTVEKSITSRAPLEKKAHIVDWKRKREEDFIEKQAITYFDDILNSETFKSLVVQKAEEGGKSKEEIEILKNELHSTNLRQKSLITEYHLMWLYKAANAGIPCIIDEVNIIRPEVFMALHDILTRKPWDTIQLPNGLDPIIVKKWFCIILTGNDPEQNNKSGKYTSGRYNFDEASYNRLRIYAKNYLNQTIEDKKENRLEELDKTYEYLYDNELFGVILMMMFQTNTRLNASGKYWFELMKKDFNDEYITKEQFFISIKKFAEAISKIQRAFAGEVVTLGWKNATIALKDKIKRKVFSMRNLIDVLQSYKNDTLPLDFHIFNEFIKHTSNQEELYALLVVFSESGFFGELVTDDVTHSIKNVEKKISELRREKDISPTDIDNKIIITKQDLYSQYFGNMSMSDEFFESKGSDLKEKEEIPNNHTTNSVNITIEYTAIQIQDLIDQCTFILLNVKTNDIENIVPILLTLNRLKDNIENIDSWTYNRMYSILLKVYNLIDAQDIDIENIMQLLKSLEEEE